MVEDPGPTIFPALRYSKGSVAIEWFKAMGFDELLVVRGPSGRIAHAEMKLGAGVVHLGEKGAAADHEEADDAGFGVAVYVDDVDGHYARARSAGADITKPPYDTDYGARMYSVRDPEGNLWTFGNYRPGAVRPIL
jgi:uncharacterized glyoxalase superfamily protein PhnB